ncbi:DUF397 domain-containing protein [Kibdelosporangium phytohabitans]|uniref:DUF397 domain-containing protein n=1 Tax=Kibdelosporangium phytohabitans TaxID=860235 RepID=UPI0007C74011|nr:DUF397 domain-containing protein [Kibdelosporangium phytohabitans]MBE1467583.1 hypothetical protein [Kibdelosporangium phytohabitans]
MSTPKRRAGWRKSTYSDQGNGCVEVDFTSDGVEIRHSKIPDSPVIRFTEAHWSLWLDEVINGDFTNSNGAVIVTTQPNAWTVHDPATAVTLVYDRSEWWSFERGVRDGEFDPKTAVTALS